MTEKIFNVFLFVENEVVVSIGATMHERDGEDGKKLAYLQSCARADWQKCNRYPLPEGCILVRDGVKTTRQISYDGFMNLPHLVRSQIIDEIFQQLAPDVKEPLMVVTPIVDGKPLIEAVTDWKEPQL